VLPTSGHTCGSLSVVLHDGQALVGDLVSSGVLLGGIALTGRSKSPPFEDDPHQVADELERLASGGSTTFYMGQGGPLPKAEVLRHVRRLRMSADARERDRKSVPLTRGGRLVTAVSN
jgi:hydroxyacylglutathione hydrolase